MRSLTLLNDMGDLTITWDKEADEDVIELIKKKMEEGVTFFSIDFNDKEVEVNSPLDINNRKIHIRDKDIPLLYGKNITDNDVKETIDNNKNISIKKVSRPRVWNFIKNLKKPEEIKKHKHIVGVKPLAGG